MIYIYSFNSSIFYLLNKICGKIIIHYYKLNFFFFKKFFRYCNSIIKIKTFFAGLKLNSLFEGCFVINIILNFPERTKLSPVSYIKRDIPLPLIDGYKNPTVFFYRCLNLFYHLMILKLFSSSSIPISSSFFPFVNCKMKIINNKIKAKMNKKYKILSIILNLFFK